MFRRTHLAAPLRKRLSLPALRNPRSGKLQTSSLLFLATFNITSPMLAKIRSAAVNGIEAYPVEVEVNAGYGDTIIVMVVNKLMHPSLDVNTTCYEVAPSCLTARRGR